MEKVSAIKRVALFLMIVGLAVAMVACQGAVGPKGDKGDKGTDGTDGTDGTSGSDGINALIATNTPAEVLVSDKPDPDGGDEPLFGDLPAPFSVANEFVGGHGTRTYKLKPGTLVPVHFTAKVATDGMVTLTKVADTVPSTDDGGSLVAFSVEVTDENDIRADKMVSVKRNIAPVAVDNALNNFDDAVGTQPDENPALGRTATSTPTAEAAKKLRPMLNQYQLVVDVGSTATGGATGEHFNDIDPSTVKIMATSSDDSVASVSVEYTDDGPPVVVITGHTATDDVPDNDIPAAPTIKLKAIDNGGLESDEVEITVSVMGAPSNKSPTMAGPGSLTATGTTTPLVRVVVGFFTPAAGLTYTAESDDTNVLSLEEDAAITNANGFTGDLDGTPNNEGSATVTVTARDTIGQFARQSFTVAVDAKN